MKRKCKNCGSKVEYFNIDYDEGKIRCFYCNHVLPNEMFFNDLTVNKFAEKIPEVRRDEFLAKLGFEKKPVHKSAIFVGLLIALIPIVTLLKKGSS
jgi:transcription initiation factor TFIIIB Brf1 subunit/transcription initiation factor TFIIB